MKKLIICFLCFVAALPLFSQQAPPEYKEFITKAESFYKDKEYKKAALAYSSAFKSYGWLGASSDRYNAARAWSMAKIPDSAFYNLYRLINKKGYDDYDKIIKEEAFNPLYADKRWQPLMSQVKLNKLPTGWGRAGSHPSSYTMCFDSVAGQDGKSVLTMQSNEEYIDGFGTLMQNFLADKYLGKRIMLTGYMKSNDVKEWAGFWMRVDEKGSDQPLAFDNMQERPITGTTPWKKYEIILDVPQRATNIAFGALLSGTGQIWFEKLDIQEVDMSFKPTGIENTKPNLDFNK